MKLSFRLVLVLLLLGATLAPGGLAQAVEFKRQVITMSTGPRWLTASRLMDIDDDGLTDLLAVMPLEHELQVYRQQRSGFTTTPDQTIALPEQTAWIGSYDVDAHPGKELLLSTAAGLFYLRQNGGVFEPSPRMLIEARQVFLTEYPQIMDVNGVLPVVFEDHAVLYEQSGDYQWRPGRRLDLHMIQAHWQREYLDWTAGANPSHMLSIETQFRTGDANAVDEEPAETPAIRKLIEDMGEDGQWGRPGVKHQDVNGDGRQDAVIWKSYGEINPKTTVLVFLRGRDDRLPEKPTHVLRGNGVPICVNNKIHVSPMWDLDGDGKCELILVALKSRVTSWSGLVNIALSGGVDWIFTVRSGRDGKYSGGPDFEMEMTSRTPSDKSVQWLFRIDGDFNGDGREDVIVERSSDQFDVYLSDADAGFFRKQPPISLRAPVDAWLNVNDLNGDGLSDLVARERRVGRVTVFLSESGRQKGTRK
jgi:hypothetical protein